MKNILSSIAIIILLASCGAKKDANDLDSKIALLKEKQGELTSLQTEIKTLNEEIEALSPEKTIRKKPVTTTILKPQEFNRYVEVQASVISDDVVMASSETGGRITNIYKKEGDYVKRGQIIATIDLEPLEKQLAEIETSYSLALDVFNRQQRLWEQNIGSEIQFLQAKNNKERLEKSMATLQSNLSKKNIYAPISGYVDREFLQQGELAAPGMPIVQIINSSKVKVVADLSENYLGSIKKGQMAEIYFPALDRTINKKINMIGRTVDPSNRTFKIEIETNNPDGSLKPNLLADVKLNDFSQKDAIAIPIKVILEEVDGRKYVFVAVQKGENKVAQKAYVKTGESYQGNIIISEGLKAGDELVEDGVRNIIVGDALDIEKPTSK